MPFFLRVRWAVLLPLLMCAGPLAGAPLSDPQVDNYNLRIGTQTFTGLYHFTPDNLLVETANAITNMGSDTIKMYLGSNFAGKYWTNLSSTITNLWTLARNEPNCRHVLDMPFRHIIAWAYPFANPDAPFQNQTYTAAEQTSDYREMYDLTHYLLTNYNNSGKTFYLGHWEGDGYLKVNNWSTNPAPYVVSNMVIWENTRQKGVDDARTASAGSISNVQVFYYAEVNRVHDAIYNGPTNNVRCINCVVPYVTNLDFVSYSSYDGMNYAPSTLYPMLNYIETNTPPIPAAKAGLLPSCRLWIGEYGWGGSKTEAQQEPTTRAYIQTLLNYSNPMPFILFWEIYNNETNKLFCLIDSNDVKTACFYLHNYFYNSARLATAGFKETNGRLPSDSEFVSLVSSNLDQPLPAPVPLSIINAGTPSLLSPSSAQVAGTLTQGVYGDQQATVRVFYGRQDGGTVRSAWEQSQLVAVNTNFNPRTFTAVLTNLAVSTTYAFRFYATNASGEAWAPAASQFVTPTLDPSSFACSLKITFSGYNRPETLTNFPVLVNLGPSLRGFSYKQFASPSGGDLRFTDSSGEWSIPFEIDEWNTSGTSRVWVSVPRLSGPTDCIYAYWGNPLSTNLPVTSTNGAVWAPNALAVYHLEQSGFPYLDSTEQHSALSGTAPGLAAGFIDHGASFNGSSQFLDAGTIGLGNAFTLSAWVNLSTSVNNMVAIWANKSGGWNANGVGLFVNDWTTTDRVLRLETGDGSNGTAASTATNAVSFGQWHWLAATVDAVAHNARLYVDGVDATQSGGVYNTFATGNDVNLGRVLGGGTYFNGTLDEARIESTVRSANWIWASWMTAVSNSTLASYATTTQQSPVLSLSSGPGGLSLTWPTPGTGFALYTTTNLTPPVAWVLATNQPTLVNSQWQIALPQAQAPVQFYRLQSQ